MKSKLETNRQVGRPRRTMSLQENTGKVEKKGNSKITRALSVAGGTCGVVKEEKKTAESTSDENLEK